MKRKTTITLTIAALLGLTGVLYAAPPFPPSPYAPFPGPIGVAVSATDAWATEFCTQNLDTIDCLGHVSFLATIPGDPNSCTEKYLAVAPSQAANAGFTARDVFVTQVNGVVYKVSGNTVTPFVSIPGCTGDTGITFDHFGPAFPSPLGFQYNMIVTCENGPVWRVASVGGVRVPTLIANTGVDPQEGPAIQSPTLFGSFGGQILVADENTARINAIDHNGIVTLGAFTLFAGYGPEGIDAVPEVLCTHCSGGVNFQTICNFNLIISYPAGDFTGLRGNSISF